MKKKIMTCQIVNLKIQKKVKPVNVVNYNINAANCDVISMMQYVAYTVNTIYTTKVPRFVNK